MISAEVRPESDRLVRHGSATGRSDRALRELAKAQHGVLSLHQLASVGLSERAVRHRAAAGRLSRVHAGVYATGPLTNEGRWAAALLVAGGGAVLSHRSAAALWEMSDEGPAVELMERARVGRSRQGVTVHRAGTLTDEDRTSHCGFPCTTVARTLLDLAGAVGSRTLERAVERAERSRRFDLREVADVIERVPRHRGVRRLRSLLDRYDAPAITRSEAEERAVAMIDRAGLPRPRFNAYVALPGGGGYEIDLLWDAQRLAVEIDGRTYHATLAAFTSDRERDRRLTALGFSVIRYTAAELIADPDRVARELRTLLRLPER